MKVRDYMTTPAITVGPDTPFADIVDELLTNDVSGLPVVDDAGHLLGVVTEADLISKEAYGGRRHRALGLVGDYLRGRDPQWVRKGAGRVARELMTAAPATASPDDDLAVAARRMLEAHHKRLPVLEDGHVVGIVTRQDLLEPYHRSDGVILSDIEDLVGDVFRVPEDLRVTALVTDGVVTLEGSARWPSDVAVLEAVVAREPGVVAVENRLSAREPAPRLSTEM